MLGIEGNVDVHEEEWAPVSDLMAVLMLIFMLIATVYVRTVVDPEKVFKIECDKIFQILNDEFHDDFKLWDAELDRDLTIRFRNPEVLFLTGDDEIRPFFRNILSSFFPRYLRKIDGIREDVREIRVEGHTSSEYGDLPPDEAYLENMRLSHNRTVEILSYILTLPSISRNQYNWSRRLITANGLSSSKLVDYEGEPVYMTGGEEDKEASRRVEFRLVTTSCQKAGVYEDV